MTMTKSFGYLLVIFFGLMSVSFASNYVLDPHSQSNFQKIDIKHLHLGLRVDFEQKILEGYAELDIAVTDRNEKFLWLDTKDLDIKNIQISHDGELYQHTQFCLGERHKILGSALKIAINENTKKVRITYKTTSDSSGLQWLTKEQTGGKKAPFLYTKSEPHHARSFMPIADSPQVRFTYSADICVPEGMMALMSAKNPQKKNANGIYHFAMEQRIPAYLVALAVGDLEYNAIGPRTGVYSEPYLIGPASEEFSDMENMLIAAEELFGPYLWEQCDVVIMPPSFPIGGMENPRALFISKTVISGEKEKPLVNVIAHEIAHNWFGNSVTNASWGHLWLNEGFTVWAERKILERLYGKEYALLHTKVAEDNLKEELKDLTPRFTSLFMDLSAADDPSEAFSLVSYEKGARFLSYVEEVLGSEYFINFMRNYANKNKFQPMTTEHFKTELMQDLSAELARAISFDEWVYSPGLPESFKDISCDAFNEIAAQAQSHSLNFPSTMNTYSSQKWQIYISAIKHNDAEILRAVEKRFKLSEKDAEIKTLWFLKLLDAAIEEYDAAIGEFMKPVGRGKFIVPLYKKLMEKNKAEFARSIFAEAKPGLHPTTVKSIEAILYGQK